MIHPFNAPLNARLKVRKILSFQILKWPNPAQLIELFAAEIAFKTVAI